MFRKTRRNTGPLYLRGARWNNSGSPFFMEYGYPEFAFFAKNTTLPWAGTAPLFVYPHKRKMRNPTFMPFIHSRLVAPINRQGYIGVAGGTNMYHNFLPGALVFPGAEQSLYQGMQENQQPAVEAIFQNPLQPANDSVQFPGQGLPVAANPYAHPYPIQANIMKPPSGIHSIMNSFKTQEGSIDIKKMIDTAGQMAYAVNQVQSLVKGLGGILKV